VDFTARLTVWFEIKEGKPSISVSRHPDPEHRGLYSKPLAMTNAEETQRAILDSFPRAGRVYGKGATVYARATVDQSTGAVSAVDVVQVRTDAHLRRHFAASAVEAIRTAKYDVTGRDPKVPIQSCITVDYRIQK
jgi:NADH:ubiquinone oxidoreductase subunit F (NADH-binding)